MKTLRLISDSGKVPLFLRLYMTPFGLLGIWGAFRAAHDSLIASILFGTFGILLLSIWFWRSRMFYDSSQRQFIVRGFFTLGLPWRISLTGADAVLVHKVYKGGFVFRGPQEEISIRYQGGKDRWITSQPLNDPEGMQLIFSEVTGLPIIQKQETEQEQVKQVRASLIAGTLIGGGIVVSTFFSKQPSGFLWIFRGIGIVWLIGWWRRCLIAMRKQK